VYSAFHSTQSVQSAKVYTETEATVNARLSSMLQYMFCASRFAHYLKVMARDKVGKYASAPEYEDYLNRWLMNYTDASATAPDMKARYPLREGRVAVREVSGSPGRFTCDVFLRPHFQLEQLVGSVHLSTRLTPVAAV
jgi:type VI secretion system ImpC/EvpB family protein